MSPAGGSGQLEKRYEAIQQAHEHGSAGITKISDETRENMDLLLSVLNEKQRRLYLGLESIRLGHGGDVKIPADRSQCKDDRLGAPATAGT